MKHPAKVAVCEKVAHPFFVQIAFISLKIIHSNQTAKVYGSHVVPHQAFSPPHVVRFPMWSSRYLWKAVRLSLSLSGLFLFRSGTFLNATRPYQCTETVVSLTYILPKLHPAPCPSREAETLCTTSALSGCPPGVQASETTLLLPSLMLCPLSKNSLTVLNACQFLIARQVEGRNTAIM